MRSVVKKALFGASQCLLRAAGHSRTASGLAAWGARCPYAGRSQAREHPESRGFGLLETRCSDLRGPGNFRPHRSQETRAKGTHSRTTGLSRGMAGHPGGNKI